MNTGRDRGHECALCLTKVLLSNCKQAGRYVIGAWAPLDGVRFREQVVALAEYRAQLFEYLRSRMTAIAPNLTVGVMVACEAAVATQNELARNICISSSVRQDEAEPVREE